jgi:hypothetical protein
MTPGETAEALVAELGISEPKDLDVEALAFDAGMMVRYQELRGCEATLVGVGNRAIATIKPSSTRGRERFSVAHELGHWSLHRGCSFKCRVDDVDLNLASDKKLEQQADSFAAHLLLPTALFKPAIRSLARPSFPDIEAVAAQFETSVLATALRVTTLNTYPAILACYNQSGLRWCSKSTEVPTRWWLKKALDPDSFSHDLLYNGTRCDKPGKQSADAWFENDDSGDYEVIEECVPGRAGEVVVLLHLADEEMLSKEFDSELWVQRRT